MTVEEMKRIKIERGYSNVRLSELSGVPETTIQKIFSGTTSCPRYDTLQALEKVLGAEEKGSDRYVYRNIAEGSVVRDSAGAYAYDASPKFDRQGTYTITDREKIPEDIRTELIDGVIYEMASPTPFHQLFAGIVHAQFLQFISGKGGDCVPFVGPVDVQLDRDEKTMLVPDVVVVCHPEIITNKCIYGEPDFVLEVISPSTKRRDYTKKLSKYQEAGVREYWIVDPYQKMVFVYYFAEETKCPAMYGIDRKIPVNIYDGELEIDLTSVLKWIM